MRARVQRPGVYATQPQGPVGIDRSSSLCKGLEVAAYPLGIHMWDAASRRLSLPVSAPAAGVATRGGRAAKFTYATNNYHNFILPRSFTGFPHTMLVIYSPTAVNKDADLLSLVNSTGDRLESIFRGSSSAAHISFIFNCGDGTFPSVTGASTLSNTGSYVAVARQTGASSRDVWLNGKIDGSSTTTSGAITGGPATKFRVGVWARPDDSVINGFDGYVSLAMLWSRALNDQEIQELYTNPWQVFANPRRSIFGSAGGPTTYPQALTAALTFSTARIRGITHGITAAACGPSGVFTKLTGHPLIAAAVNYSGTIVRRAGKALTGAQGLAGAMGPRSIAHGITAAMQATATNIKFTTHGAFTAVCGPAGAFTKLTGHISTAAMQAAGSMVRNTSKGISAAMQATASMARSTAHNMTAAVSFSKTFTRVISHTLTAAALTFLGELAGSLNGGAVSHQQAFTAAMGPSGSMSRAVYHALAAAALATAGTLVRSTAHALQAAAMQPVGALARQAGKALAGAVQATASMLRSTGHGIAAACAPSGALTRLTRKVLTAATIAFSVAFLHGQQVFFVTLDAVLGLAGLLERPYSNLRRYVVAAQNRVLAIIAQNRARSIEAQNRARSIDAQDREQDL